MPNMEFTMLSTSVIEFQLGLTPSLLTFSLYFLLSNLFTLKEIQDNNDALSEITSS
jgi:hypothetical protein